MKHTLRNVVLRCCCGVVALQHWKKKTSDKKWGLNVLTDYFSLLRYTLHILVCDINTTTYIGYILVNIEWQANDALTVNSIMYCKPMSWFLIICVVGCWIVLLGKDTWTIAAWFKSQHVLNEHVCRTYMYYENYWFTQIYLVSLTRRSNTR